METADMDKLAAIAEKLRLSVEDAAASWPQPTEVKSELPSAPPFDGAVLLPKALRDFVLDEADRMPCSPDYVAVAVMVALGAVIGARVALKPKRRDDWIVTPNLFGGVVGDPSSKKTPAINTALRYLDRLEAKEAERHEARTKVHAAEMAAFEARQGAIQAVMKKAAIGKGDGLKMDVAVADLQGLLPPEEPAQRRFKTNDGTVAKIGDILARSPAGLLVFRDELVGLLASWDREGNEGDRAFYLEGFNGTGSFNIDRIGRGSLFVKTLCLSVFGGIQPELLERYLAGMVNSMDNDGRFQRFQMLVYPEPVVWQWRDRYPVKGAREGMRDLFDRLADFDPVLDGATPADDFIKLPWFHFDEAAQEVFIEWATELHLTRIAGEQNPLMRQHLAKFEKLFCSLALILHLAEGRIGPVQADTALSAAAWCDYLEGHARRIYGLVEVAKVSAARTLSRRLLDRKLPVDGFTARDVMRKGWMGLKTSMQAETALAVLEEHNWVVASESAENNGRPTTKFYVNPLIYGGAP
jgi:hypothetical protein